VEILAVHLGKLVADLTPPLAFVQVDLNDHADFSSQFQPAHSYTR
jgi:hypothetical protein